MGAGRGNDGGAACGRRALRRLSLARRARVLPTRTRRLYRCAVSTAARSPCTRRNYEARGLAVAPRARGKPRGISRVLVSGSIGVDVGEGTHVHTRTVQGLDMSMAVLPKPQRLVVHDGRQCHVGTPPHRSFSGLRVTLAWKFAVGEAQS